MSVLLPARASDVTPMGLKQRCIYVDARMLYNTGIGRHIYEHIRCFAEEGNALCVTVGSEEAGREIQALSPTAKVFVSGAKIYGLRERFGVSLGLEEFAPECDVFWFPQYNVPFNLPKPSVVTIHDLIQFRYNRLVIPPWRVFAASFILKKALADAALVTCVSGSTRLDLLELDGGLEKKLRVVRNGVSSSWSEPSFRGLQRLKERMGDQPFLLSVSQKKPHKNQKLLLDLLDRIHSLGYPHKLVLVGRDTPQWRETLGAWASESRALSRLVDLGEVDDELLASLYYKAELFLLPSLYEGFGLTVLEAMAAGAPVVVSNRGALPETVGDAGELLDPLDLDAWVRTVVGLLEADESSRRLAIRGKERARSLNWKAQSQRLLGVFDEAMQV